MTGYLDEAQIEAVAVDYFRGLGYEYAHSPSTAPNGDAPERTDYVSLKDKMDVMDAGMDVMA